MEFKKEANVLGTTYAIVLEDIADADGECDFTNKTIRIRKENVNNVGSLEYLQKKSLRHELIHAFMFESGLAENWEHFRFGHEELTVDWFAILYPKIRACFDDLSL